MDTLKREEWRILPTSLKASRKLIEQYHYAGGAGNTAVYVHGLFRRGSVELMGVAWWCAAVKGSVDKYNANGESTTLVLQRLVLAPDVPKNGATFLLGGSIRLIEKEGRFDCLLTYADTYRNHTGAIYKASNWEYLGLSEPTPVWVDGEGRQWSRKNGNGGSFTHEEMKARGAALMGYFPKHVYRMRLNIQAKPCLQQIALVESRPSPAPKPLLACRPIPQGWRQRNPAAKLRGGGMGVSKPYARAAKPRPTTISSEGMAIGTEVPEKGARTRYVVSLSSGVPSAVAAEWARKRYGAENVDLVFADTTWEDDDNYRFLWQLCQRWGSIKILMDGRTPLQVAEDRQIIPNQKIAPCTFELKIKLLQDYAKGLMAQGYRVVMVIGMDYKDKKKERLQAPIDNWRSLGVSVRYPLLIKPATLDPIAIVRSWGIEPPRMYRMGYKHANCGGRCVKQGHGDWRRTMTYFPSRFTEVRTWETEQRRDIRFADYAIMKSETTQDGERITIPLPMVDFEARHLEADARQQRLFELEDDLQGCGSECGVNADWRVYQPTAGESAEREDTENGERV